MARLAPRLTIVPIRVSSGRSGGGGARASRFGGWAAGRATTGGRREAENSGRSRVAVNPVSGTAHNGLPLRDDVALGRGVSPSGAARPRLGPRPGIDALLDRVRRRLRGEGRADHENDRQPPHQSAGCHCPTTPTVIRMRPLSGSPKNSGDWIESLSTNKYGIPASMS